MSARVKVTWILVCALLTGSLVTITLLTRVTDPPPCRLPHDRATLASLSPGALMDLRWRPEARLDLSDVRTPTEAQAKMQYRIVGGRAPGVWVCGWKDGVHDVVIRREREVAYRCYGGSGCPDDVPTGWITCYSVWDIRTFTRTMRGQCLGWPKNS